MQAGSNPPLSSRIGFRSLQLSDFSRYLSGSYCDHRIFQCGEAGAVDARHHRVPLGNISLNYLQYGTEVEINPGLFETFYMLEMPISGSVQLDHGGQTVVNRVGTATIVSPSQAVRSLWSEDCGQRMIKISLGAVERQVARMLGRAMTGALVFDPLINLSSEPGRSIVRLANFLYDQYEVEPGLLGERRVSEEIENALITLLLLGQPNSYSDALAASGSTAVPRHVRRALAYIEQNLREDISIEQVIEVSAVSARALYTGFERFVGTPPQLYIRNRRLDGVHDDLIQASAPTTVSELAMDWGFTHFGRFSAEYRRRFDELPSETLRR